MSALTAIENNSREVYKEETPIRFWIAVRIPRPLDLKQGLTNQGTRNPGNILIDITSSLSPDIRTKFTEILFPVFDRKLGYLCQFPPKNALHNFSTETTLFFGPFLGFCFFLVKTSRTNH